MATEDLGNLEWERSKISQQDVNLLKKLGISGKQDALRFPKEESYPAPPMQYRVSFVDHLIRGLSTPIHDFLRGLLFMYGLQLHHLTPNSILHISIFITLCESFLGVQPNWSLWKRIFFCRRNGSSSVAYNIGGVVICVRPDVEYFDVKFPDSVQGWRKKWLYIREENHGSVEDNIPPFDGAEKICRRRSWDAEATDAEKAATEALMTRIHELQNTRGQELSGIQITAYFLRIRVQPLQARKNPLWMYAGDKDVDRLSVDLSVNDLAKLVRKISSLNKKDSVPTSCGVTPYSATNALPQVEKLKKGPLSLTTTRVRLALRVRPQVLKNLRHPLKRTPRPRQLLRHARLLQLLLLGAKGKETMMLTPVPPKPVLPVPKKLCDAKKEALDLYEAALISSGDEEEDAPIDETARTSTSRTLVVSEARPDGDETSPPQQNPEHPTPAVSPQAPSPKRARVESTKEPTILAGCSSTPLMEEPFMKELIRFGTQFIGYREYAAKLEEKLAEANKRADALAAELEQSETARMKAEADAATVEDLQKRLDDAKNALEENVAQHSAREEEILSRLESQSRRFVRRTHQEYELENPEGDQLLDALSLLEIHAVTRCSGGDGGVDGGDDDDDDGDDVQLDDDGDGVDFPLREGISHSCPPESSFLSGVLRPVEAAVTLREVPSVA
ncbi:hypothetical protein QYE76_025922 [Lolium multiflorum]|uniref:Transposase (putative) gypsy type domain-containing protein n=1 Tax=Lolium multiflorum TaxID=4521 RepID=A0AAD8VX31_LOLMU|nr:hypothetical protein QYE76_025922 [Lolium multiflorum]